MTRNNHDELYTLRYAQPNDVEHIKSLLQANALPVVGVAQHWQSFLVADTQGCIIGALGAHYDGKKALLRSFVVNGRQRNSGIGKALLQRMLLEMQKRGIKEVFLLTETAANYFMREGFIAICRDEIPQILLKESGLDQACPCSSQCLKRQL
ncbi:MAG: GCN5-related N-acetyltransferase [Firmicutes bacterium]|nr:GCN5-related N-acetyltransferase [Bacillota bacterium]